MLSRPTTDQVLLDCRAELLATIGAAVPEGPGQVAVQMMENVLRNCAVRAAHEVAWMHEEGVAMVAFAERVAATPLTTPELGAALTAHGAGATDSRHLDEAAATYDLAGRAFGAAMEAVLAGEGRQADELHVEGRALLDLRLAHEREIMGEWAFVGRA